MRLPVLPLLLMLLSALPALAQTEPPAAVSGSKLTSLTLIAVVTEDSPPIRSGLVWRVLRENPGKLTSDERLQVIATSAGGDAEFLLEPGSYLIHAAYGRAAATTRVDLDGTPRTEKLIMNAGGVRLTALLPGDRPLPEDLVSFDVYSLDNNARGEEQVVVKSARPGKVIRLNADTYRIIGRYGDVNVTARAELHVNPGKLTEATLYLKGAKTTFKLTSGPGSEALANVTWTVVTRNGEALTRMVGAYPATVLAAGDYSIIAKQGEQVYSKDFTVESGFDREIELTAK